MSTNDVPGFRASNNDVLAMGCWAEHQDGSLIFVEGVENGRVIYSIFDAAHSPVIEYRDAMPEIEFKTSFSWKAPSKVSKVPDIQWTWHDKTPFPWDRVIKKGAKDGQRLASAADQMTAAQKVAESLRVRGQEFKDSDRGHLRETIVRDFGSFLSRLGDRLQKKN